MSDARYEAAVLSAALDYARRGWPVFPCHPSANREIGKKPLVTRDRDADGAPLPRSGGLYKATIDEAQIREWWTRWPKALIGVPMGRRSGVFAIDLDTPKSPGAPNGAAAWAQLVEENGGIAHTHTQDMPSGGRHILFRWRDDRRVTNSGGHLPPAIDVRGEGGYIIVAPSRLTDGRAYQVSEPFDFFRFAEAPDWLYRLLDKSDEVAPTGAAAAFVQRTSCRDRTDRYAGAALEHECRAVATASPGCRNKTLNRAAFNLGTLAGGGALSPSDARDRLIEAAAACGLPVEEARATIESGLSAGAQKPRLVPESEAARPSPAPARSGSPRNRLELSEDGAAQRFSELYENKLRYCHDTGAWFEWTGTSWRQDRTRQAFQWARELARRLAIAQENKLRIAAGKTSFAAGVERFCRSDPVFAVTVDAWDNDPFLLGTPGGTVELRTGALRPAQAADGITKLTSIAPVDDATCPRWLAFLEETCGGDRDLIRFLQQWCGYCLTGVTREHALVFGYGPGGNGKSVFQNTVHGIMGDYATIAAMDTFTASTHDKHPTDLAMLRGARLVTASETEEGRAWAESRIKQMTGGDPISARFMRQDFFTFRPTFKLMIIGNHKPVLRNVDDATRRRFNIVPFTRKPARVDRELEEKLKSEWPGILRWMIDGCLDWQANGLVRPAVVVEATEAYFSDQDMLAEWMQEHCLVDQPNEHRKATTQELFESWSTFAKASNEPVGAIRSFAQTLEKRGFAPCKNVPTCRGKRARGFTGIQLRADTQRSESEV